MTSKLKPITKRIFYTIEKSKETDNDLILLETIKELSNICDGMYAKIIKLENEMKEIKGE